MENEKIKEKDKKRIEKAVSDLNAVMEDIRMYIPDANYFVNGEYRTTLNLMTESFDIHDTRNQKWKDSLVLGLEINHCDCGGF